jgi:hypothetical protein
MVTSTMSEAETLALDVDAEERAELAAIGEAGGGREIRTRLAHKYELRPGASSGYPAVGAQKTAGPDGGPGMCPMFT